MFLRLALAMCLGLILSAPIAAQDAGRVARVDVARSDITETRKGVRLSLALSQGVPYRVFTLAQPPRLVVDFQEVAFDGVSPDDLLQNLTRLDGLRLGSHRPGWSRLVADMTEPMRLTEAAMTVDRDTGRAMLRVSLEQTDAATFAAEALEIDQDEWIALEEARLDDNRFVVVIDPGHGGVDPGAIRGDVVEKELMLEVGLHLRDALRRSGQAEVFMTRDRDTFVSLKSRVSFAHQVDADLILSLHADTVAQGRARGTTIYTLSEEASDAASSQLAQQHDRADLIAGLDLSDTDDQVSAVLLSLARQETQPRADALADAFVSHIGEAGVPMNRHPRRFGSFSVLKSADIPSVLIEIGFLSDARDLENLRDPVWRKRVVEAMATAILDWRAQDVAVRALVRQ